ncbi:hypothetical protein ALON55S_00476 [Alishewanella longhuensis]
MNEISSAVEGGVLTLSMHRPEKKNALNLQMYRQLTAALQQAQHDVRSGWWCYRAVQSALPVGMI